MIFRQRRALVLASLALAGAQLAMAQSAPAASNSSDGAKSASEVCHSQVPPEMPRQALLDGVEGTVRVSATVRKGVVHDVEILSGPEAYHQAVKNAMAQYMCEASDNALTIRQDFNFVVNTDQRTMAVCPVQYRPYMPQQALMNGISSVVKVKGRLVDGEVKSVEILSGHRVYWESVKAAVMKYQCLPMTTDFLQQFSFQLEN